MSHVFSTTVVIPFNIVNATKKSNLRILNFLNRKRLEYQEFDNLEKYLKSLSEIEKNKVDSGKYHDHVENYIGSFEKDQDNSRFLKVYQIKKDSTELKDKKIGEILFDEIFCNPITLGISKIESVLNKPKIILNKIAQIGYVIFKFDFDFKPMVDDPPLFLERLSNIEFFRYYDQKSSKYKINLQIKNRQVSFSLKQIMDILFGENAKNLDFFHSKPILFHLALFIPENLIETSLYKLLRIPPREENIGLQTIDKTEIGNRIYFVCMNEGAIVLDRMDNTNGINSIFNKYFPAFILALNQREIMIKIAKLISELSYIEINNSNFGEKLSQLRKQIHILQLKQIFYNISNYNEIALFYEELHAKFNLEVLLKDNKESIESIHGLIESENNQKDKKRDENIGIFIFIIAAMDGLTLTIQVFEDKQEQHNQFKLIFFAIGILGIIWIKWRQIIKFFKFR